VPPSAQPRPAAARRTFAAPLRVPDGIAADAVIDLGDPAGEAGGVEGGIPGGVVGAVVGTPPPPPTPVVPVRVGRGIQEPEKVRHVPPVYPAIAVRAGVSGTVVLECLVSPQGRVTGVQVLRGIPLLDAAAVEAVRQWVYTPTLRAGAPVPVILTVTVTFALDSGKGR
jgi:protein TonB